MPRVDNLTTKLNPKIIDAPKPDQIPGKDNIIPEPEKQKYHRNEKFTPAPISEFPSNTNDKEYLLSGSGKVIAVENMLTAMYGKDKSIWEGAIRTASMQTLSSILPAKDEDVASGSISSPTNIAEQIAAFFENNPKGKLNIFCPLDGEVHELGMNEQGVYYILNTPVSDPPTKEEQREFFNFINKNIEVTSKYFESKDAFNDFKAQVDSTSEFRKKALEWQRKTPFEIADNTPVKPLKEVKRADYYYWDRLSETIDKKDALFEKLNKASTPLSRSLKTSLGDAFKLLDSFNAGVIDINIGNAEKFRKGIEAAKFALDDFIKNEELTSLEKKAVSSAKALLSEINDPNGVIAETQRGFDIRENQAKDYAKGNLEKTYKELVKIPPEGICPSVAMLHNFDITKANPNEVLPAIIWRGVNRYASARMYDSQMPEENYFGEGCNNILQQLSNAPLDVCIEYLNLITNYEVALKDKLYETYQKNLAESPIEDAELYAAEKLQNSPEFTSLNGINILKGELFGGAYANILLAASQNDNHRALFMDLEKRPGYLLMSDLVLGGDLNQLFEKKKPEMKLTQNNITSYEKAEYPKIMERPGVIGSTVLDELIPLYEELMDDPNAASDSFIAMRNSMHDLMSMDGLNPNNREEFNKKIDFAKAKAQEYYDSHNRIHFTSSGRSRFALSDKLIKGLENLNIPDPRLEVENKINKEIRVFEETIRNDFLGTAPLKSDAERASVIAGLGYLQLLSDGIKKSTKPIDPQEINKQIKPEAIKANTKMIYPAASEFVKAIKDEDKKAFAEMDNLSEKLTKSLKAVNAQLVKQSQKTKEVEEITTSIVK